MPVTTGRKSIRFKSAELMLQSIEQDALYQHRHLLLSHLMRLSDVTTRKRASDATGIPINAMSKVVAGLVKDGALEDTGYMQCPDSGRACRGIRYNHKFKGPF